MCLKECVYVRGVCTALKPGWRPKRSAFSTASVVKVGELEQTCHDGAAQAGKWRSVCVAVVSRLSKKGVCATYSALAGSYESIALTCRLSAPIHLITILCVFTCPWVLTCVHVLLWMLCVSRSIAAMGRTLQRTFL